MKNALIIISFLSNFLFAHSQIDFEKETFSILKSSELVIAGSTNVNHFACVFDINQITKARTISFMEDEGQLIFKDLELHLLTEAFDCGNKKMNSDFQDLLVSKTHPEIVIIVNRAQIISEEFLKAFISLEIAGITRHYEMPVQLQKNKFKGKLRINIRDFQLEPPKKALGLIEVEEMIEVQFNFNIKT